MPSAHRYALYFAPPEPWRSVGNRWLGRCPETGAAVAPDRAADPRRPGWTSDPRHYGLHATLKPPFRLSPGSSTQGLDAAVRALAARTRAFDVSMRCRELRGFLAWCLADDAQARARMQALSCDAVQSLDSWRAPPTEDESARRRKAPLSPEQKAMLDRWGYPYVFDQFVFHITLSNRLQGQDLEDARRQIEAMSAPARPPEGRAALPWGGVAQRQEGTPVSAPLLDQPMPVRAVSLYAQPEPGAPFLVARHYGFDGMTADCAGAAYLEDPA